MCLIAFAWMAHPRYALVVAANRDEFHERPTLAAHWWTDAPIFAGRDERGGGTWMGVSRSGRFAALTNVRDPARQRADARSRGLLVSELLADARPLPEALAARMRDRDRYNGFTLVAAERPQDGATARMFVAGTGSATVDAVAPGVHALSNAALDTPWPKVVAMHADMEAAIGDESNTECALIARLEGALDDRTLADDADLPSTGVPLAWERLLSARLIVSPGYGTRSSTIVLIGHDGRIAFIERDAVGAAPSATARFAVA